MSRLFGGGKVERTPSTDPADAENRRGLQRVRRLSSGGSNATLMGQAMSAGSGAPRAVLTGAG